VVESLLYVLCNTRESHVFSLNVVTMDSTEEKTSDFGGPATELSIEDENRMRAQLGLAPLATGTHREVDEAELRYKHHREEQKRQSEHQEVRGRIEK
jgi:hypothetical protein